MKFKNPLNKMNSLTITLKLKIMKNILWIIVFNLQNK